ncbi:MAG TPA: phage tail protein [Stellaceae bacterium]|nr:phage tail protein [Stellaceae bacterium]
MSFTGSVYGDFGLNRIWANGGVAFGLGNAGLNGYAGGDGQAADPVFASSDVNQPVIGYSGTCYVTGTPLNLGSSSAIPDISFEITGFESGTGGPGFPDDARPDLILTDILTNPRYGAGFPAANLDTGGALADWGNYCQAAQLAMSLLLDKQQPAARWIEEMTQLTVSAVVWSGILLKIIPYGDQALSANAASWTPNLTWHYSLGDGDFLPWSEGGGSDTSDPVLLTRSDPAQATNWLSVEYMDAGNSYNPQIIAVFDQGTIDQYGVRTEPSIQAHEFTNPTSATISAQLMLQRRLYVRNTYNFKLGWKYALLEPMDIVLITDAALGLAAAPVRVTQIAEDDNGALTVTAEEIPGLTP